MFKDELKLSAIITKAIAIYNSDNDWKFKFYAIFSSQISGEIYYLCEKLNISMNYYDLDTTYKEDVEAYICHIKSVNRNLNSLFREYISI